MSSGKARYNGRRITALSEAPPGLAEAIGLHDPSPSEPSDITASEFVNQILDASIWAKEQLHEARAALTRQDAVAEYNDIIGAAKKLRDKLRKLSPDCDSLLGVDVDPLMCAHVLDDFIFKAEYAGLLSLRQHSKQKPNEAQHLIAVEMASRILAVARERGIKISGAGSSYYENSTSPAAKLLKTVGDAVGLTFEDVTWRDIIIEIKKTNN